MPGVEVVYNPAEWRTTKKSPSDNAADDGGASDALASRSLLRSKRLWAIGFVLLVAITAIALGVGVSSGVKKNRPNQVSKTIAVEEEPSSETFASLDSPVATFPPSASLAPTISSQPTRSPTEYQSRYPTTDSPSSSTAPSFRPTTSPSGVPSWMPSELPTVSHNPTDLVTFRPGELTHNEAGLTLSAGLRARLIAETGKPVKFRDGSFSSQLFHGDPDMGAVFRDTRGNNPGGWVYVSNAEKTQNLGGVGALTFFADGQIIGYDMLLTGTNNNCGGGKTPWNTWVTCEEMASTGNVYQVDPLDQREPQLMTLGMEGGAWESFAYDVRDSLNPAFFVTEDAKRGCLRRFRPHIINWQTPWDMLHSGGIIDYLYMYPNDDWSGGTYEWTTDREAARNNAQYIYPNSEGIDIVDNRMYVISKVTRELFIFDLDGNTYSVRSTESGLFDGEPDQVKQVLTHKDLLFFTEDTGAYAGIHARDSTGKFFTILESSVYDGETAGIGFSPDGKFLYFSYQHAVAGGGLVFEVWRDDGLPFQAKTLDVRYHNQDRIMQK